MRELDQPRARLLTPGISPRKLRSGLGLALALFLAAQGLRSFLVVPLEPYVCLRAAAADTVASAHAHEHELTPRRRNSGDSGNSFEHCKDEQPGGLTASALPFELVRFNFTFTPEGHPALLRMAESSYIGLMNAPPTQPPRA